MEEKDKMEKNEDYIQGTFEDFIGIWDNNVDENICKEFIEYYDWTIKNSYDLSLNNVFETTKKRGRDDVAIHIGSSSKQYPDALCKHYWNCLSRCVDEYMTNYSIEIVGDLHSWGFKIHKVKEKQGYHMWHYENGAGGNRERFLVYMTYLQAPSEGGETEFLHQSKRIDPVVGRTLIWPPSFTHQHRGNPPLKGEKLYLTGWMNLTYTKPILSM